MQTSDVREAATQAVNQSKSFLGKQVDERSTQIGAQIGSVAQELRTVGDQLRGQGMPSAAAGYVDRGAEFVENISTYLQDADSDRLIADLETLARRQPWAFAAGALVLGFAASRFLKTSSTRRFRDAGSAGMGTYRSTVYGNGTGSGRRSVYGEGSYGVDAT